MFVRRARTGVFVRVLQRVRTKRLVSWMAVGRAARGSLFLSVCVCLSLVCWTREIGWDEEGTGPTCKAVGRWIYVGAAFIWLLKCRMSGSRCSSFPDDSDL
ncbi:hypothetical protein CABS01_02093 [Colletotrichum abscissum]|uniref:Uncharacterized protein n=1 Tax=Colletotrichum lupini TaxID=145971 RepID=A0A9Q8SZR7_9PEZI|nr:uncharacterized protein CLUP02_12035 [Colletotrichum lupini]XP_060395776.1 uncharacterized protein CABS01_02093 [Colletotrichum abscissum]KAK1488463.1 hypothetical protein CABS01_02093 [Colletotrichum abscissum]KAK1704878.1 hypothetical protein BDP67DRAFT_209504 [Colletotrichum lupini]UQC86533.1 hypothetical protein CLUP02_12035 [Colletotrichum lupini]